VSVHIDISVVIPEQCVKQAWLWTVKVLRLACGCFWVYSSTNFTTGRKNVELLYQVTLTTFGATVQKVVKFERLFRLKEMFNRVTLTDRLDMDLGTSQMAVLFKASFILTVNTQFNTQSLAHESVVYFGIDSRCPRELHRSTWSNCECRLSQVLHSVPLMSQS